eukprot:NODE_1240_length_2550_cov_10.289723.p1 GENE.NODE_1240_length_2550_cov_10.289723~~NODE_1240_length_2550_cov_10.289723.p1  ORF type:complete len:778 (-),score=143.96 NODE_1240_length_2550_cov_10.289723:215-2374(-)
MLTTWTAAGRCIAAVPWPHEDLLAMGWSLEEVLICVLARGTVDVYSVICEALYSFAVDAGLGPASCGLAVAVVSAYGLAAITHELTLFASASVEQPVERCCAEVPCMRQPPLCLCVLPIVDDDDDDDDPPSPGDGLRVLIGTAEGPVYVVSGREAIKVPWLCDAPYVAFAVSGGGHLVGCLNQEGVFKVLRMSTALEEADASHIEFKHKLPRQMVWCGEDCIVIYLASPSPMEGHTLLFGGPQNDWIPCDYDGPLHLAPELDGCRIVSGRKMEWLQRVPTDTDTVLSPGTFDVPVLLRHVLMHTSPDTWGASAATVECDADTVERMLNAVEHERGPPRPEDFEQLCRQLRFCIELRKPPMQIPVSLPQLQRVGVRAMGARLVRRRVVGCQRISDMVLSCEPRAQDRVHTLLELSCWGDYTSQCTMTRQMAATAARSCDPDLIYDALCGLCGRGPFRPGVDLTTVVQLVRERPQDLQVFSHALRTGLRDNGQAGLARIADDQLGYRREAACSVVRESYQWTNITDRIKWLACAGDHFLRCDVDVSESEYAFMHSCSQATHEAAQLLHFQVMLTQESEEQQWPGGPHHFAGLPLVDTLRALIALGKVPQADHFATFVHVPSKRYWRIKVNALADCGKLQELSAMATSQTAPVGGYEVVVEQLLRHQQIDLAKPIVPKVKNGEKRADFYARMGMLREAEIARNQHSSVSLTSVVANYFSRSG